MKSDRFTIFLPSRPSSATTALNTARKRLVTEAEAIESPPCSERRPPVRKRPRTAPAPTIKYQAQESEEGRSFAIRLTPEIVKDTPRTPRIEQQPCSTSQDYAYICEHPEEVLPHSQSCTEGSGVEDVFSQCLPLSLKSFHSAESQPKTVSHGDKEVEAEEPPSMEREEEEQGAEASLSNAECESSQRYSGKEEQKDLTCIPPLPDEEEQPAAESLVLKTPVIGATDSICHNAQSRPSRRSLQGKLAFPHILADDERPTLSCLRKYNLLDTSKFVPSKRGSKGKNAEEKNAKVGSEKADKTEEHNENVVKVLRESEESTIAPSSIDNSEEWDTQTMLML